MMIDLPPPYEDEPREKVPDRYKIKFQHLRLQALEYLTNL
jgi:hypothetical protein